MNNDYEKALEARVDRALKQLPDLSAPPTLLPRILASVERRARMPWYRQAWQAWPAPLRVVSLALVGGLFVALWWGEAQVSPSPSVSAAMREVSHWRASVGAVCGAVQVLYETALSLLKSLGPWFLASCLLVLVLANAVCMGLGTLCLRFSFARSDISGFERTL